jgi:putative aminopeptidase FrvX
MNDQALRFLKSLLDSPGPSGFETRASDVWRREASSFAIVTKDVAGNSLATVNATGSPTILLAGHIDEIGVITQHIDDDGFISIQPIGGWDPEVFIGQRIRFLTRDGDVSGVIGKKPIHLMKGDDRKKSTQIKDLWVDIGAANRVEAEERLSVGDPGVIDAPAVELSNARLASRAIDNRIGAFIVLEALRRYSEAPGPARVLAAATTQEEIGYRGGGAQVGAFAARPQMAIVVDVTFATDHPGLEKKELGDYPLGSGPVISRGSIVSPVVFELLRNSAGRLQIPVRVQAAGGATGTDADAIHLLREGIATAVVSIPNRYMHSPNEMVSLNDVEHAIALIAETCRQVSATTDFLAR